MKFKLFPFSTIKTITITTKTTNNKTKSIEKKEKAAATKPNPLAVTISTAKTSTETCNTNNNKNNNNNRNTNKDNKNIIDKNSKIITKTTAATTTTVKQNKEEMEYGRIMKQKRKHKMPETPSLLIVVIAVISSFSIIWLNNRHNILKGPLSCYAYNTPPNNEHHHQINIDENGDVIDDDDYTHHMLDAHGMMMHHDMIGESEEHDHIAHHLEMQNHEELLEDIREDTAVNIIPDKDLPKFGEPLQNVTVPVSREAVLQCVVDNLQTYKIAWLRVDTQTILTIQNHVITKNHRMSITHAEKRAWILRIRDVKESDKGWYMCQINTDPMKSQVGYLDVVVPPDILDYPTSTDMVIREGSNVTLKCAATGSPTPTITWRREGGELIPLPNGSESISYNGSFLTIAKVNRLNMGAYLCIASNGIPPTVSKRVMLIVHFPPMIWIQNQLVGAAIGQNITLECQSEAFPKSINYWMKNDTIIVPGERFVPETFESGYKITMRLTINDVDILDFGSYRCVAKNSLGDTDGAIKLYHIPQTTTVTTVAPTPALNTVPVVIVKNNKEQRYNNNKVHRTKSKADMPPSSLNNVFATSSLYNTQGHTAQTGNREHYHQSPDHSNYRADSKAHNKHNDANSLTNEIDELHHQLNSAAAIHTQRMSELRNLYLAVSLLLSSGLGGIGFLRFAV